MTNVTTLQHNDDTTRLQQEIDRLAPWFHNLHLPDGTQTVPNHALGDFPANKWRVLEPHIPADLTGWRVLDIGCNSGFYSFKLAERGAEVLGIDSDSHYLAQAHWAAEQFGFGERVQFRQMQVYDLAHIQDEFDLVLFMGVFYHLRYPMLGLDIVAQKTRRLMVFQSLRLPGMEVADDPGDYDLLDRTPLMREGVPRMVFIEHRLANDPTNWWVPNHAGIEAMLRAAGMQIAARLGHEMYVCAPDPEHPSAMTTWNRAEYLAAVGKSDEESEKETNHD
jgi:tRNA (mo5U34)-methyltransferase